jgi:ring-1,2-phenylacetyl-CoA epoxidase subunit PaaD
MANVTARAAREARVWDALATVNDPEMPGISIVDLGMVQAVTVKEDSVQVALLPTFVACPALGQIQDRAVHAVADALGVSPNAVSVRFSFTASWSSARIRPSCFDALKARGIAPPPADVDAVRGPADRVPCPWCGSLDTQVEGWFGPTLCRSTHFCRQCRNVFEAIKPV